MCVAVFSRTLSVLWEDELPDELVCSLRVQRQGITQRLQVWTLFQEGLLQADTAGVEVLLRKQIWHDVSAHSQWTWCVLIVSVEQPMQQQRNSMKLVQKYAWMKYVVVSMKLYSVLKSVDDYALQSFLFCLVSEY